jgi:multidrug resistance efflux pump
MNDTVRFKEGQIFSDTPQLKIKAPNEVKAIKVLVKEGQEVQKGDTLFVLENKKTISNYDVLSADVNSLEHKFEIYKKLLENTKNRKNALIQLLNIQSNIYNTDRKKTALEIQAINNKINLASQQTSILTDKYKTDSLLYAKGAISRYEMTNTRTTSLVDKKGEVDIKSSYIEKNYDYENLYNNYKMTKNDLSRSIIEVDNQIQNFQKDLKEIETAIKNGKSELTYVTDEVKKLTVISPFNGTISNMFNTKQNIDIIDKGELLAIIAPKKENFYAKVILDEKDIIYVKKAQEINLKLDAYNYYRFGAIKGKITYVSPSDVDKTFYCLARIEKYNPNINLKAGYKLKGEVIVEEMKVYQYIFKKLFNKIDNTVN